MAVACQMEKKEIGMVSLLVADPSYGNTKTTSMKKRWEQTRELTEGNSFVFGDFSVII